MEATRKMQLQIPEKEYVTPAVTTCMYTYERFGHFIRNDLFWMGSYI